MRVLGIDPGTRILGFGFVESQGSRLALIEAGALELERAAPDLPGRLAAIHRELFRLIERMKPDALAIEEAFHGRSAQAALRIGEARGAALAAGALAGVPISQYPPATMKKALTGNGRADKSQVAHMVVRLLGLSALPTRADVSDALGIAICHCFRAQRSAAGLGL
ncbi:MAG: crossover junction endodeoxyribonuclease RuvC [Planctomycetes bacterium]|nr:crossover junction endodeoxyribonuclease RuvC [Planctomycetota bacterium]